MEQQHAIERFVAVATEHPDLRWYAIVDSAQDPSLPDVLKAPAQCLLGAARDTPQARKSPHLVKMGMPAVHDPAWRWVAYHASQRPCATVVASPLAFEALFDALAAATEITLPDASEMVLAYWDPAILGTLIGQKDDLTLHVPGPVLSAGQRLFFANRLARWWYWDRAQRLHEIDLENCRPGESGEQAAPFRLSQAQIDDLVEASMPDHVLYFVELNQAHLLYGLGHIERYDFVSKALIEARTLGLEAMRDLVNYVCVALIYKDRLQTDPDIIAILAEVHSRRLSFDDAMQRFP
jgi:hypothetical protein